MFCWGRGLEGQLGQGDRMSRGTPTQVGTDEDWEILVSGRAHVCGRRANSLFCWGNDSHGQTGQGTTGGTETAPVEVLHDDDAAPGESAVEADADASARA